MDQVKEASSDGLGLVENGISKERSLKLVVNEPIGDTGFRLVGKPESEEGPGMFGAAIGTVMVSEWVKTEQEVRDMVERKDWRLIQTVCIAMANFAMREQRFLDSQEK